MTSLLRHCCPSFTNSDNSDEELLIPGNEDGRRSRSRRRNNNNQTNERNNEGAADSNQDATPQPLYLDYTDEVGRTIYVDRKTGQHIYLDPDNGQVDFNYVPSVSDVNYMDSVINELNAANAAGAINRNNANANIDMSSTYNNETLDPNNDLYNPLSPSNSCQNSSSEDDEEYFSKLHSQKQKFEGELLFVRSNELMIPQEFVKNNKKFRNFFKNRVFEVPLANSTSNKTTKTTKEKEGNSGRISGVVSESSSKNSGKSERKAAAEVAANIGKNEKKSSEGDSLSVDLLFSGEIRQDYYSTPAYLDDVLSSGFL